MKRTALIAGLWLLSSVLWSQTSTIEGLTDATTISEADKVWMVDVSAAGAARDVDATLEQIVSPFAADPSSNSSFDAAEWAADLAITSAWADITGTPTTLSGYGITDAATAAQGALADSAVQSVNLSLLRSTDYVTVRSDQGADAQIYGAGAGVSGIMTWADKQTLDSAIQPGDLGTMAAENSAAMSVSMIPLISNTRDIGTAAKYWNNFYIDQIHVMSNNGTGISDTAIYRSGPGTIAVQGDDVLTTATGYTQAAADALLAAKASIVYFNGAKLAGAIGRARYQRVALVGLGDSNQLLGGYGFSEAISKEFSEEFGVFGSGVHRNFFGTPTADFVSSSNDTPDALYSATIPEALRDLLFDPTRGAYWVESSASDRQATGQDFCIKDPIHADTWNTLFPLSNSLKYDIHYGVIKNNYLEGLTATDAVWQSGNTVRFSITESLGITYAGQYIVTTTFANPSNNGNFLITAVGVNYVDATTARTDAAADETTVTALADIAESQVGTDGAIAQFFRLNESPYTSVFNTGDTSTFGADYAIADLTRTQGASASRATWSKYIFQHRNNNVSTHGPVLIAGQQLTSPDILTGVAHTTMVYEGGGGLDTFYNILYEDSTDASIVEYWRQIRLNLNGEKSAVVFINSALNDRNETELSPAGQVGDAKGAYAERLGLIIDKLSRTWQMTDSSGYAGTADSLHVVVMPSHPISDPDDAEMVDYRIAAQQVSQGRPHVSFIMIPELVPHSEFVSGGYYASGGGDTSHLTRTGYRAVAQAVVDYVKSFEVY